MVENSKLVMTFKNRIGKNVTLSIDDPRDDLTEDQDVYKRQASSAVNLSFCPIFVSSFLSGGNM